MMKVIRKYKKELFITLVIFLGFSALYGITGKMLADTSTHPYEYYDVFFDLDVPRVIRDMTDSGGMHNSTQSHPLYVFLVNPLGRLFMKAPVGIFKDNPINIAIFFNSIVGAINVALAFFLFRLLCGRIGPSVIGSLIFGFAMSQLFMSIVPETATLATFSLMTTYLVFWKDIKHGPVPMIWWILSGILTLGVTITNFIQTLICYFLICLFRKNAHWLRTIRDIFLLTVSVLGATFILTWIARQFYPSYFLLLDMSSFVSNNNYIDLFILKDPFTVMSELIKHMFLVNVVSCAPNFPDVVSMTPFTTCSMGWDFSIIGYITLAVWFILIFTGNRRENFRESGMFYWGLGLCFLFNFVFHLFFVGTGLDDQYEYFLFTGNFTFLAVALVISKHLVMKKTFQTALVGLLALLVINNMGVISDILKRYDNYPRRLLALRQWDAFQKDEARYLSHLVEFKNEQGVGEKRLPETEYFLFGIGNRGKFIYTQGLFHEFKEFVSNRKHFESYVHVTEDIILPHRYAAVVLSIDGVIHRLFEDERGIHYDNGLRVVSYNQEEMILPEFNDYPYPDIMKVLFQEAAINLQNRIPFYNYLTLEELKEYDAHIFYQALKTVGYGDLLESWMQEHLEAYDQTKGDHSSIDGNLQGLQISRRAYPLSWRHTDNMDSLGAFALIDAKFVEDKVYGPSSSLAAEILLKLIRQEQQGEKVSYKAGELEL